MHLFDAEAGVTPFLKKSQEKEILMDALYIVLSRQSEFIVCVSLSSSLMISDCSFRCEPQDTSRHRKWEHSDVDLGLDAF